MMLKADLRKTQDYPIVNPKTPTMSESESKVNRNLCCGKIMARNCNACRISPDVKIYGNRKALAKNSIKINTDLKQTETNY